MPLAQLKKEMRCVAKSVVSGVDIVTFDIEVLDVVAGDSAARAVHPVPGLRPGD